MRGWSGASDEEARAQLQARLNFYAKVMFWSFVALIVYLYIAYRLVLGARTPRYSELVLTGSAAMLAVMAVIWRAFLARGARTVLWLYRLDAIFAGAIGVTFGASAIGQYDLQASGYTSLIFTSFHVFTRALIVPSSARRTAVVSSLTFGPLVVAALWLALNAYNELPPLALVGGAVTFVVIAIVIASNGSAIIYGLRQDIDKAMRLGQYTLVSKIGEGGIGKVYRANHALLRRPTAIKLLQQKRSSPEDLARFEEEVQRTSELTHPNTVAIYDYGVTAYGVFYYAMEYLDGINLQQLVQRYGPQPEERVVNILAQVCGALQEAHGRNLIHRDIKPANIILCHRGGQPDVAKVVDFGLVKDVTRTTELTGEQTILGTPLYLAPEVVTDNNAASVAGDLYALGCVAYYLLAGRPPFEAKSPIEVAVLHVTKAPPPLHGVSASLEALIMRCLAKAPSDRPASAAVLVRELAAVTPGTSFAVNDAETWWRAFFVKRPGDGADVTQLDTVTVDIGARSA